MPAGSRPETAVGDAWPISQITYLGRRERMPFRRSDMQDYLKTRLHADLRPFARFIAYAAAYADIERLRPRTASVTPRYSGDDVSILMCTHNDADLAEEGIASVRAQTTKVREIIVLDDGSSSPEMCGRLDRLAAESGIRLIRRRNMG